MSTEVKKVFIKTFGCQMNDYDSDRMMDSLSDKNGMVQTDVEAEADVILMNTCIVRKSAWANVIQN